MLRTALATAACVGSRLDWRDGSRVVTSCRQAGRTSVPHQQVRTDGTRHADRVQARVQAGHGTGVTASRTYAGAMRSRGVALLCSRSQRADRAPQSCKLLGTCKWAIMHRHAIWYLLRSHRVPAWALCPWRYPKRSRRYPSPFFASDEWCFFSQKR